VPPIPPFSSDGLLPPYLGASPGESPGLMSPYKTSLTELVARFATSPERIAILQGFLTYRADLHGFGLVTGFQWIDGSFVERVDTVRPPRDIDLVTFFERPAGLADDVALDAAVRSSFHLFSKPLAKPRYLCDVHFVDLSQPAAHVVGQTRYWFGLFSHKRSTFQWKGMLEIPLERWLTTRTPLKFSLQEWLRDPPARTRTPERRSGRRRGAPRFGTAR
jgi:hypothetical protein